MPHLTARTRLGLAVKVKRRIRFAEEIMPVLDIITDQVCHNGIVMSFG